MCSSQDAYPGEEGRFSLHFSNSSDSFIPEALLSTTRRSFWTALGIWFVFTSHTMLGCSKVSDFKEKEVKSLHTYKIFQVGPDGLLHYQNHKSSTQFSWKGTSRDDLVQPLRKQSQLLSQMRLPGVLATRVSSILEEEDSLTFLRNLFQWPLLL